MSRAAPERSGLSKVDLLATAGGLLAALLLTMGARQCVVWGRVEQRIDSLTAGWPVDAETRARMGRIFERELRPLLGSPLFDRFVDDRMAAHRGSGKGGDEGALRASLGSTLEARGRRRLPDEDLAVLRELKRRMALASERACPCHFDPGPCSQADVMDGLARLSDEELRAWYRLAAKAALLELEAPGPACGPFASQRAPAHCSAGDAELASPGAGSPFERVGRELRVGDPVAARESS